MALFQNKYRVETARLSKWDYGSNAPYFVTICTKNRLHNFGEIIADEMRLSDLGANAVQCWQQIPEHFPFVKLDVWIVMPNHVHGIIIIDKPYLDNKPVNEHPGAVETQYLVSLREMNNINKNADQSAVETQDFASLREGRNQFGPQSRNLGSIIRGFKIGVTKYANLNNIDFGWQARFHDHIIRNEDEYQKIGNYIVNNPLNWANDMFNKH